MDTASLPPSDPVFSLGDLETREFPGTALAVLGHPIQHSLSPAMHNAALAALARDHPEFALWRYHRFDVPPDDLPRALDLFRVRGFRGLNLTVPHKVIAFECIAKIDPAARPIGAVNTLVSVEQGWRGFNTDGPGLASGIHDDLGAALTGTHVILLGAGGAARAAAVECLKHRCASLWIANRTPARLHALLALLRPLADQVPVQGFDPQCPPAGLPAGALVINATASGLHPDDPPPVDLARLPRPAGVYDMIYNPPETLLLRQAAALEVPRANGLSMLVHQGAHSLKLWTGLPVPVAVMMSAARAAMQPSV